MKKTCNNCDIFLRSGDIRMCYSCLRNPDFEDNWRESE